ncbi:MAG: redoxin domain-containing protein [Chthonomonadales bacterium]
MPFRPGRTAAIRSKGLSAAWVLFLLCTHFICGRSAAMGQPRSAPRDGLALLRWSMARTAALRTFRCVCDWTMSFGQGAADTRAVRYLALERPNRFKIVARLGDRQVMTSVCDGVRLLEFSNRHPRPVSYPAPPNPAAATSLQMGHPMFCGSLLYQFFLGPSALNRVVDLRRGRPVLGRDVIVDGAVCRTVRFYARGTYGTTEVAIALKDGLVRRIRYNSEPLLAMVKQDLKGRLPVVSQTTEIYRSVAADIPIAQDVFRVPAGTRSRLALEAVRRSRIPLKRSAYVPPKERSRQAAPRRSAMADAGVSAPPAALPENGVVVAPKGLPPFPAPASGPRFNSLVPPTASGTRRIPSVSPQPPQPPRMPGPGGRAPGNERRAVSSGPLPPPVWLPYVSDPPRVPLGTPAPPFVLVGPDGSQLGLANLRGKVVILTFWATWEPRCADWLARLQALAKLLDEPRLVILAVAHQPRRKAEEFARGHGISLPLYEDPGRAAGIAYRVPTVPTTAILDGKGVLRAYIIGMPGVTQLRQELEKAGLYDADASS